MIYVKYVSCKVINSFVQNVKMVTYMMKILDVQKLNQIVYSNNQIVYIVIRKIYHNVYIVNKDII